jgi:hypothetical protein
MKPVESDYPPDYHRSRKKLGISIAIIVIVIISVFAIAGFNQKGTVNILYIRATLEENGTLVTKSVQENFHTLSSGGTATFRILLENALSHGFTFENVEINETGFSVLRTNLPLHLNGNSQSILNLTISLPKGTYAGDLDLVLS